MSDKGIKVRIATEADAHHIGEIHAESLRKTYAGIVHEHFLQNQNAVERGDQVLRRIKNFESQVIVAELNGRVIGFADFGASRNPEIAQGQLHAIYCASEFLKLGAGTLLFKEVIAAAKKVGYSSLFVSVLSANQPAISFYKKLGGALVGHDCVVIEEIRYGTDTYYWQLKPGPKS